jgi:hypothetical protein
VTQEWLEQLMTGHRERRYYGVALAALGDDGQWIVAAGHVEARRMAAAAEAYARDAGLGSLRDIPHDVGPLACALDRIEYRTATVEQPYCTHGGHGGEECPNSPDDWGLQWTDGGPVPVTVLEWA